jgi:crossover junction endodeoxyribonuclease RusA
MTTQTPAGAVEGEAPAPAVNTLRTWTLDLPWTKPPLTLNGRMHWREKADTVKAVRYAACVLARAAGIPPLGRIAVELHYAPRDSRVRDAPNLVATLKPFEDGIVDAGCVPGDDGRYVCSPMPVLDPPTGSAGRLYVIVRELS